ncbi:MAG: sulfatase, partial [Acidimicrobiales bacterium]
MGRCAPLSKRLILKRKNPMNFKRKFQIGFALIILAFVMGCGPKDRASVVSETTQENVPPNIVWIIADDQAYSDFGFMGHDLVKTPHLDKLASESALFPNGYVPSSLCRASLATLITGKYAFDHGICFNDAPDGVPYESTFRFLETQVPIPQALKSAGYRSLQTGKFWEGVYTNGGFTDGMTEVRRAGVKGLRIGRKTMEPIEQFLGDVCQQPFFLWFAPYLPHAPFDAVESYKEPFRGKGLGQRTIGYYANISWLDDTVGELMALLEENGKADNTVIMFIVDNGWLPNRDGESFRDLQNRILRFDPRSKSSPYEGGVRTPVFVKWPEQIPVGQYDNLVSSIDLFPTTLAMAGLPQKDNLDG